MRDDTVLECRDMERAEAATKKEVVESSRYPIAHDLLECTDEIKESYEVERNFALKGNKLDQDTLRELRHEMRVMTQVYVDVKDTEGKTQTIRLRRTHALAHEGRRWRLAWKLKDRHPHRKEWPPVADSESYEGSKIGKFEYQLEMQGNDPRVEQFENLHRHHKWNEITKLRSYIRVDMGNDRSCDIHYDEVLDVEENPEDLRDFVRIEIEFNSEADAQYFADHRKEMLERNPWMTFLGDDVTGDKRYSGKGMAKTGLRPGSQPVKEVPSD